MADQKKKNWFVRHKILTGILVLIVIGVVVGGSGGESTKTQTNGSNTASVNNSDNKKSYRFDDRADKQPKDVEILPSEPATVGGVQVTISGIEYKTKLGDFDVADDGKTYVMADIALENTSKETQPYNAFDFRIQTAGGQVLDRDWATVKPELSSGDLVSGGKVSGKIVFEVPIEDGHQYIIWKPNSIKSDRAIIQVK